MGKIVSVQNLYTLDRQNMETTNSSEIEKTFQAKRRENSGQNTTLSSGQENQYSDQLFTPPSQFGLQFEGFGITRKKVQPQNPVPEQKSSVMETDEAPVENKKLKEDKVEPVKVEEKTPEIIETNTPVSNISFDELRKKLDISFQKEKGDRESSKKNVLKEGDEIKHELGFKFVESWSDYFNQFKDSFVVGEHNLSSLSNQEKFKGGKVRVLFLGDTTLHSNQADEEDLLHKMIIAMKLDPEEYLRVFYDPDLPEENYFHAFFQEIQLVEPEYVISMGATITNLLLRKQSRLSKVRGYLYNVSLTDENAQERKFKLMPIFHPEYLKVNPSMKKNTWEDLQKVMGLLGKA